MMRTILSAATLTALALLAAPTAAHCQTVVLLVDGEPITSLDIDQRAKFIEMSTHKKPARQEVIDNLIDEALEVREANRYTIAPPDSDVNEAFNNIAHNMGVDGEKLAQMLTAGGASAETLKSRLRAQIAWGSLVRGRYKSALQISDTDVEAQLQLHQPDDKAVTGYEYIVRPIVMVVPRGSPDAAFEARKRDADALRGRFSSCADGVPFARGLAEVAVRDPITKSSADLAQELRAILDKTEVGHLTPPEQTDEGIQMFALCSKRESKADAPGLKQIRDQMFDEKFSAQAKRYLAQLRRSAMIEYKQ